MAPEQKNEVFSGARHATEHQRIDRPHAVNNGHLQTPPRVPADAPFLAPELSTTAEPTSTAEPIKGSANTGTLQLWEPHAAELIDRLQSWQAELDAREAQLNARVALFELQERQFRLWEQQQRAHATERIRSATAANEELKNVLRRRLIAEMPAALNIY